ncbi:MAG: hypothetical protein FWG56_00365 [Desulfovibrionaceae bacterium]|jgi:hypothetical protein|nr:hypothetical protein [Desulfovibrionaceae bacterium]
MSNDTNRQPLRQAALSLFAALGYQSGRAVESRPVSDFREQFDKEGRPWCHVTPILAHNGTDGFAFRARRKPQRYLVVSRGFATPPWARRHGFMRQYWCDAALEHLADRRD